MKSHHKNKILSWLAIPILLIVLFIPYGALTAAAQKTYTDVNPSNSHYASIMAALELEFMTGFQDGSFKPNTKMSRGHVVKALGKYVVKTSGKDLGAFDVTGVEPFNDVPASYPDHELYRYSLIVKQAGIFTGSNNNLLPKNLITRQQMSKVLVNAFELRNVPDGTSKVTDNNLATAEYRPYIDILSENGVTTVEKFRPREDTTRAQFASFLVAAFNVANKGKNPTPDPIPDPNPTPMPNPKPDPNPIPAPNPKPDPNTTPTPNPKPDPNPTPTPNPKPDPNPTPTPNPKPDPNPNPNPAPTPNPVPDPDPLPVSVENVEGITITNIQIPQLPTTVLVKYEDDSLKEHDVTWNTAPFNFAQPGKYDVKGTVAKTTLQASIQVEVTQFNMPKLPNPGDIPGLPHEKADQYFAELPNRILAFDNAVAGFGVWAEAFNELNRLKKLDTPVSKLYDIPKYERIVNEQTEVLAQWQRDINKAKNEAIEAINNLEGKIKKEKRVEEAKKLVDSANAKMNTLQKLDKKYNSTQLTNKLNRMQKVISDWTDLNQALGELIAEVPNPTAKSPNLILKGPKDTSITSIWQLNYEGDGISSDWKTLSRDNGMIFFDTPNFLTFIGTISKGEVTLVKTAFIVVYEKPSDGVEISHDYLKVEFDF